MSTDTKIKTLTPSTDVKSDNYLEHTEDSWVESTFGISRDQKRNFIEKISLNSLTLIASITIIVLVATVLIMVQFSSRIYTQPVVLWDMLTTSKFDPLETFDGGDWGIWPMVYGTLVVGIPTLVLSLFLGLGTAIFLSEYTSDRWSRRLQAVVEFFAAMPSIILGLIAIRYLSDITRFIFKREWFVNLTAFLGFNDGRGLIVNSSSIIFNAIIVMAVMVTPTIASISLDAMKSTPSPQRDAVKALGGTKKEVYKTVVAPHAKKSIFASVLLAFGRIIGETMIVTVVLGSNAFIGMDYIFGFIPFPNFYVNGITMTSVIVTYFGEASAGSDIRQFLFLIGFLLLVFSFIVVWISSLIIDENKYLMKVVDRLYTPFVKIGEFIDGIKQKMMGRSEISEENTEALIRSRTRADKMYQLRNGSIFLFYLLMCFGLIYMMTRDGFSYFSKGQGIITGIINFFNFIITKPVRSVIERGEYGAYPSLIGSIVLVLTASIFAFPIGTATGVYLYEFARDNKYSKIIQQTIINISAIPSIVVGLFAYAAFVVFFGFGIGLLSGGLALSIMMIPVITTNTIEALRNVPEAHKESALALGATRWEAFKSHRFPYAFPSIVTGYILGIARVIGETAPILFTIATITNTVFPDSMTNQGLRILTYEIYYNLTLQTEKVDGSRIGPIWASALAIVLLFFVAILNIFAFAIRRLLRSRYEYNGNI